MGDLSILAGMKLLTLFVVVTIEISALDGHERGHLAPAKEPWKEGMPQYADNPDLWRLRAEEARAQAEQMSDPLLRRKMLLVAESYERMGLRAEARLAQELSERGGVPSDRTGSQFVLPSPGALSFER